MFYENLIICLFSFLQALISTVLAILLALPFAHFCYKFDFFGKKFFIALVPVLCIMPTKLVALCVSLFYGAIGFGGAGFEGVVESSNLLIRVSRN